MDEETILCSLERCQRKAHHKSLQYYKRAPQNPIQFRFDTLHFTNMLQAIADSLTDITQDQGVVFYGLHFLHFLPNLNMEQNSSPLDGVILKILRSRWDRNRI